MSNDAYVVGHKFVVASVASGGTGGHADQSGVGQQVVDGSLLDRTGIVVRLIQQNGVSDRRLQRSSDLLDESSDRLAAEAVDQFAEFLARVGRHGLCSINNPWSS